MEGKIIYQGKSKNGKNILFRYPISDDLDILTEYINTLSVEQTYILYQGEQLTKEQEKEYLDKQLNRITKGKTVQLLVFTNSQLIGNSQIDLKDKIESHIGLLGISLSKDARGEGIGTVLMQKLLEEAKLNLRGLKIVILSVFANNPIAKKLYEKMGFKEYGNLPNGIVHKGEFVDHIYMYKEV